MRRWIFLAFLIVLQLVMVTEPQGLLGRGLFLAHIGLGLLWQPFVQPGRRLGWGGAAIILAFSLVFAFVLDWGLLLLWCMLLAGVVGGKVFLFHNRYERLFHLLALGYLATLALAVVLPHVLEGLHMGSVGVARQLLYLAPLTFLAMVALPLGGREPREDRTEIVDFVYGVMVFLLLAVIVLGSLSFALMFKANYFEALLVTLALVAGLLMLLGFMWDPRAGFGGLGSAVAQHVMSLGLPVEDWLESLAELARREEDSGEFLEQACAALPVRLPGVTGGRWMADGREGGFGTLNGYAVSYHHEPLQLELLTRVEPSPSLRWYYDLVVRLLAEIYQGKRRAEALRRLSHVEAIHETGARLTHDVKNLLQSLDTLCGVALNEPQPPSARFGELLRRQLPEIAARLRQTLAKLSAVGTSRKSAALQQDAQSWLQSLEARYPVEWLEFITSGDLAACQLADAEAFSSILENLLQNIADKRHGEPHVRAVVRISAGAAGLTIDVCDSGSPIRQDIAAHIFSSQVDAENGLGIGLYQCARMAAALGYRLELKENRAGAVCFDLAPEAG